MCFELCIVIMRGGPSKWPVNFRMESGDADGTRRASAWRDLSTCLRPAVCL